MNHPASQPAIYVMIPAVLSGMAAWATRPVVDLPNSSGATAEAGTPGRGRSSYVIDNRCGLLVAWPDCRWTHSPGRRQDDGKAATFFLDDAPGLCDLPVSQVRLAGLISRCRSVIPSHGGWRPFH